LLIDSLIAAADRRLDVSIGDPFRTMKYGDFVKLADVMRRQVVKASANPRVGMMMPSTCIFGATLYGILWAQRTAVPLNFLLQPAELAAVVKDAGLDVIFTVRHFADQLKDIPVTKIFVEDLPLKREMILGKLRRLPAAPKVDPDAIATMIYTSGTSGVPKGVCQTYRNLKENVVGAIRRAELEPNHRFLGVLPLSHSFGLTAMLLVPVELGASVHYVPRFNPASVIDAIKEQGSSVTMMIASMYTAMLKAKRGGGDDISSITYAVSGGEALSMTTFNRFRDRFGVSIIQGYGMTECSPVVSLNIPPTNRPGTIGKALPNIEVNAFDDAGKPCERGHIGELWIRGPIVMKGYFGKEADTRAAITPEGWYKSGDMGVVEADGFMSITGRKKEMIIVGGENVYPREIEAVLDEHPAVAESAVVGQQDASRGEIVVAFVIAKEGQTVTEMALREHCRERVAGYKAPRKIIIATDLPRGPTGKIIKRKLVEMLSNEAAGR
jgi:long-chain acyl-CoA synthetase